MNIIGKMKEAAGTAVEVGKKAAETAKEKVEDVQLRRKADDAAKQLGYIVVEKGGALGDDAQRLITQIKELESQLAAGESGGESPGTSTSTGSQSAATAPSGPMPTGPASGGGTEVPGQ